ncbi:MAG: hypothetical protein KAI43_13185, partial [Candidatus Aureabacteria bacterium]|nr:hypothetical protein [Candidatus Auribacterota bacterium]
YLSLPKVNNQFEKKRTIETTAPSARRSVGVTMLGRLLVIPNSFFLLAILCGPTKVLPILLTYSSPQKLIMIISLIFVVGGVFAGVQILRLKEFARKLIIFLAILDIPLLIIGSLLYAEVKLFLWGDLFNIILSCLLDLIIICFFTRSKVKEQFK